MDARQRRIAENESLFREVNERIEELAATDGGDDHVCEFVCECSDRDCVSRLSVPHAVYIGVRADPRRFIIKPEHYLPEVEQVVDRSPEYWVIEKKGEVGELAERFAAQG
jgi:hypothetical protein